MLVKGLLKNGKKLLKDPLAILKLVVADKLCTDIICQVI